ncbi:MAG: M20 family metallo-hydrolase [Rikenellaceae bacterium]
MEQYFNDAVELLRKLIATPSISKQEDKTAQILFDFLASKSIDVKRSNNNVWAKNLHFDTAKTTILLNSHHDTVKPNSAYTRDPFAPTIEGDYLYGLGSNDAGASGVCLLAAFVHFYHREDLPFNLIVAITAEEENSGTLGLESLLPELGKLDVAIVGEPTKMQPAVAERGLMVIDCIAHGKAGHAARNEGDNAIFHAIKDIEWFNTYRFERESELLGPVKMTTTIISAGSQHNVVPAECKFTVDIRSTDAYTNGELVDIIKQHVRSEVLPRSTRLSPSAIALDHPLVLGAKALGRETFISPTTSDQALLSIPSMKMGVGDSARSHSADEYVLLSEIKEGIGLYIELLENLKL